MTTAIDTEPGVGDDRRLQLVGLARRAGQVVAGTQAVREAARRGELNLLLVARDAADSAHRRVRGVLLDTSVATVPCGTRETLGRSIGREMAAVVGITDRGLAVRIMEA